jgi:hypothetical protein
MNTSASHSFLSEILFAEPIPLEKLAFFRARAQSHLYDLVVTKFLALERDGKLTRAELARRIGKQPAQITRLLGAPGNWTVGTGSDLLLGMGEELDVSSCPLAGRVERNFQQPEWVQNPGSVASGAIAPEAVMITDASNTSTTISVTFTPAAYQGIKIAGTR